MSKNESHSGEIAELGQILPVPAERDLPAGREQILEEYLMREFRMKEADGRAGRTPQRSWRPRPAILAALTGGAAVATAAAVILATTASPASSLSAGRVLLDAAYQATRQPDRSARPGQYNYIKISFENVPWPGSNPARPDPSPSTFPTYNGVQQAWSEAGVVCGHSLVLASPRPSPHLPYVPAVGVVCPVGIGFIFFSPAHVSGDTIRRQEIRQLTMLLSAVSPRSVLNSIDALDALVRTETGVQQIRTLLCHCDSHSEDSSGAFYEINDLLYETVAYPRVSAVLYRAAALIPGGKVITDVTDTAGRPGVAVAFDVPSSPGSFGFRQEVIFDKKTLQFIGERTITDGVTVIGFSILAQGVVDHPGQVPAGPNG
jgi:hypothetical protein